MAVRLPQPGSDEGSWGDILNSFLSVEHNTDGTLKKGSDITQALSTANAAYVKPAAGIPKTDLHSSVQASLNSADASVGHTHVAANITDFAARVMDTVQSKIVAGSNVTTSYDSTTGELTVTATIAGGGSGSTTVDSVAGRVGDVVIVAGDINSGVFNVARIPTGTTGTTVALGNHTHDDRYYTETEINTMYGNVTNTSDANKPVSAAQAAAIASAIVGTVRVALWNGSNYLVGSTIVTSSNRVAGTYYKFVAGPDPATLGLAINGDEWKTTA